MHLRAKSNCLYLDTYETKHQIYGIIPMKMEIFASSADMYWHSGLDQ